MSSLKSKSSGYSFKPGYIKNDKQSFNFEGATLMAMLTDS